MSATEAPPLIGNKRPNRSDAEVEQEEDEAQQASVAKKVKAVTRKCTCKSSKCLKKYCDCFAAGELCGPHCKCEGCSNTKDHKGDVEKARARVLRRNPHAFDLQTFSCSCKKSKCKKGYCECFAAGKECNAACKCIDCHNRPLGSETGPAPEQTMARATALVATGMVKAGAGGAHSSAAAPTAASVMPGPIRMRSTDAAAAAAGPPVSGTPASGFTPGSAGLVATGGGGRRRGRVTAEGASPLPVVGAHSPHAHVGASDGGGGLGGGTALTPVPIMPGSTTPSLRTRTLAPSLMLHSSRASSPPVASLFSMTVSSSSPSTPTLLGHVGGTPASGTGYRVCTPSSAEYNALLVTAQTDDGSLISPLQAHIRDILSASIPALARCLVSAAHEATQVSVGGGDDDDAQPPASPATPTQAMVDSDALACEEKLSDATDTAKSRPSVGVTVAEERAVLEELRAYLDRIVTHISGPLNPA